MDKTNDGNNKGRKRIKIEKQPVNEGNKHLPPKYENFKGDPIN